MSQFAYEGGEALEIGTSPFYADGLLDGADPLSRYDFSRTPDERAYEERNSLLAGRIVALNVLQQALQSGEVLRERPPEPDDIAYALFDLKEEARANDDLWMQSRIEDSKRTPEQTAQLKDIQRARIADMLRELSKTAPKPVLSEDEKAEKRRVQRQEQASRARARRAKNKTIQASRTSAPASRIIATYNASQLNTAKSEDSEELMSWQQRSLCSQVDPGLFSPEKGESVREAKSVCKSCEVKQDCLDYALEHNERFGVWGGLSEGQRRKLRKRAVPNAPILEDNEVAD